jgi:hypothetical protein
MNASKRDNNLADAIAYEARQAAKLSRVFNAWQKARRAVTRLEKRAYADFHKKAQS